MRFLLLLVCIAHTEQVLNQEQDGNRLILKNSKNASEPCEGHVKISHQGTWGYAGDEGWSSATEEVVCRSAHCGSRANCSTDVHIPARSKVWLNEMSCSGNESHPWGCKFPGWDISIYRKDTVKRVRCSNRIRISLEGFRCAGAVQYFIDKREPGYFCADNWGRKEADRLCKSLKCGKSKDIPQQDWMVLNKFEKAEKVLIQCSGLENEMDHLWQCVTQESATCSKAAFVECEEHERLQLHWNTSNVCSGMLEKEVNGTWERENINTKSDLWCQQMNCGRKHSHTQTTNGTHLTCKDEVSVHLTNDRFQPTGCYGKVSVRVNGVHRPVCAADWNDKNGEVVCRELNCGKAIVSEAQPKTEEGIMDNVNCLGNESSLWYCRAKRGNSPLTCSSTAHVVCQRSLDVRLTDGPGRCAGRLEIWFNGQWMQVSSKEWTANNSDSVCRQLQCGHERKATGADRFSQGSGVFFPKTLNCSTGTSHIPDCITDKLDNSQRGEEPVGITCEEHKVVFLEGNESVCSGLVGIEHGSRTYWLSGSNETWNHIAANLVCQQRNCGSLRNFSAVSNVNNMKVVWKKSLNCSSQHKSLFECAENEAGPDYNATVASVMCSGEIKAQLTNGCWGHVNITTDGSWGGVCADAWTEAQSQMLCKGLNCGDKILTNNVNGFKVVLKSLHATNQTTELSQCNIVKNDDSENSCRKGPVYVVCSGSLKARLSDSRDTCSGNVEVSYEGRWLPVCKDTLKDDTRNIICEELHCGRAVKMIDYFGPTPRESAVISELKCPQGSKDLTTCNVTSKKTCAFAGLQCSEWRKTTLSDSCSGAVVIYSQRGRQHDSVSTDQRNSFCNNLNCGNAATNSLQQSCAADQAPNVTLEQHAFIECQDKPKVTLSEGCRGAVKINNIEVCNTNWNDDYSHLVCHEQNCSNAIPGLTLETKPSANVEYYHVMCEDHHHKLGQCKRYKGKCNRKLVSVSCINSVRFDTSEPCGGQILVNYRDNKWEGVCPVDSSELLQKLCDHIKCRDRLIDVTKRAVRPQDLRTHLVYSDHHMDIRHCVRSGTCSNKRPAEVYCDGHVLPIPQPEPGPDIVSILLGVGFVLILVIAVSVCVRIWFIKKTRNAKMPAARMMSQRDMEFESGEFENINEDEMEKHDRFRPEAEVTTENDKRSASSFLYDDIDEVTESLPLTAARASGGSYVHEEQSADGVTYEVEDPQENYDDIGASPEITQTTAEVYDSPQPMPGGPAAAPQPEMPEEDYLVPGQDGSVPRVKHETDRRCQTVFHSRSLHDDQV